MMSTETVLHISLGLKPKYQAKDLGPMVKRASEASDWVQTPMPYVWYTHSCECYSVDSETNDVVLLQHDELPMEHGCEQTDHPLACQMINDMTKSLWSAGPTDVGLMNSTPISFQVQNTYPLWLKQYPHTTAAE